MRRRTTVAGLAAVVGSFLLPSPAGAIPAPLVPTSTGTALPTNGVTSVAMSGDTAVIGEWQGPNYGTANPPTVGVYKQVSTGWTRAATLTPPQGAQVAYWGTSVAVSTHGNTTTAAIGGAGDEVDTFVADHSGTWSLEQRVLAPSDGAGEFGRSFFPSSGGVPQSGTIALDGDALAVGDNYHGCCPDKGTSPGAIWTYTRKGGSWTESSRLDGTGQERLGWQVALSGNTLISGTPVDVAEIYTRQGNTWSHAQTLTDPGMGKTCSPWDGCTFGYTVAIDGDTVAVAAPYDRMPYCNVEVIPPIIGLFPRGYPFLYRCDDGDVYVYRRGAAPSSWSLSGPPLTSTAFSNGAGGLGISLSISGNRIVAGTDGGTYAVTLGEYESGNPYGYVFTNTLGVWQPAEELDGPYNQYAGVVAATNGSGEIVVRTSIARSYP